MEVFFVIIFWTFAIYGVCELFKNIIYTLNFNKVNKEGINLIITVKNQEENIEMFMRSTLFRIIYGKKEDEIIKKVLVTDLKSSDKTKEILNKLELEYDFLEVINWKECKEIIDNMDK